ncbi:MAG: 3'-5' exonuclease [Candidatus Competibacterales bacterium]
MTVLVFDIETVPDVVGGRRLWGLEHLKDAEVAAAMVRLRRQTANSDFLRHHLHRVVAISAVLAQDNQCRVWSLGAPDAPEKELIQRFFDGVARFKPTLVSWNGSGFDLPVLHYRGLIHGVSAPTYWDTGEGDAAFRYNNYLSRYHWRHVDVMDVLSGFQPRAAAPLDEIATLLGLPGKMGMHGSKVWDCVQAGDIETVRNYCETDVLNTYLVYLRFAHMRGQLDDADFTRAEALLRTALQEAGKAHLRAFLEAWTHRDPTPQP